ncbi:hypothetical protein PCURB6_27210 [Paenibacillus curdlanolyticus]|nr:hypothetical protein PCURB6_27210 [Paenibacillus curdlanolyticus]
MALKFPSNYAVYVTRNIKTGEQIVSAKEIGKTPKVENIKFQSVKSFSWNHDEKVSLIDVKYIENEEQLSEWLGKHTENWTVKVELNITNDGGAASINLSNQPVVPQIENELI